MHGLGEYTDQWDNSFSSSWIVIILIGSYSIVCTYLHILLTANANSTNRTLKDSGNKILFNFYCSNWKRMKK